MSLLFFTWLGILLATVWSLPKSPEGDDHLLMWAIEVWKFNFGESEASAWIFSILGGVTATLGVPLLCLTLYLYT